LSKIQKRKGEFMAELKNIDKKSLAQRERLERSLMSLLSFQNKTILVWSYRIKKNTESLLE